MAQRDNQELSSVYFKVVEASPKPASDAVDSSEVSLPVATSGPKYKAASDFIIQVEQQPKPSYTSNLPIKPECSPQAIQEKQSENNCEVQPGIQPISDGISLKAEPQHWRNFESFSQYRQRNWIGLAGTIEIVPWLDVSYGPRIATAAQKAWSSGDPATAFLMARAALAMGQACSLDADILACVDKMIMAPLSPQASGSTPQLLTWQTLQAAAESGSDVAPGSIGLRLMLEALRPMQEPLAGEDIERALKIVAYRNSALTVVVTSLLQGWAIGQDTLVPMREHRLCCTTVPRLSFP